jgi:hypothetical protein
VTGDERAPEGVDVTRPNNARVYDCLLGGTYNFPVDREVVARALQIMPDAPRGVMENRAFLRRAVRHLVEDIGIDQFLDLGSGFPNRGNVHQIAQELEPSTRVVYVDNDPMVVPHSAELLAGTDNVALATADLRRPGEVLAAPEVEKLIDFRRPVALTFFATLHHLNDHEDPVGVAARLRDAVPSGSYLALSHLHNPGDERPSDAEQAVTSEKLFNETMGTGRWRFRDEIMACFGDWELIAPGLVPFSQWRPDSTTSRQQILTHHLFLCGVARKP